MTINRAKKFEAMGGTNKRPSKMGRGPKASLLDQLNETWSKHEENAHAGSREGGSDDEDPFGDEDIRNGKLKDFNGVGFDTCDDGGRLMNELDNEDGREVR